MPAPKMECDERPVVLQYSDLISEDIQIQQNLLEALEMARSLSLPYATCIDASLPHIHCSYSLYTQYNCALLIGVWLQWLGYTHSCGSPRPCRVESEVAAPHSTVCGKSLPLVQQF